MELDEYKIMIRQKADMNFQTKAFTGAGEQKRSQAESLLHSIKNNLKLEIAFSFLFLAFDSYLVIFSTLDRQRGFAMLLWLFCICFIYYLVKLLKYIQLQLEPAIPVSDILRRYISIIQRFTRLYFQLTMILIPLIFLLVFLSGYSNDNSQYTSQRLFIYFGASALWSLMMYFFTRWYIKKLYGNYLNKLRELFMELQNGE